MQMVEQHLPAEGAADRQLETLRELPDAGNRFLAPARAAEDDHWPLRSNETLMKVSKLIAARMSGNRDIGQGFRRLDLVAQHVLGQSQHDRAGTSRRRDGKGARNEFGNAGGIVDLADPFGEFGEGAAELHLLESLALAGIALDLADEQDHRHRILPRDVKAGRRVGGAGTTGDHADARFAGQLAPGVRHHRRAALLAADEHLDIAVMQCIEHRKKALARHAGNALDAICLQSFDNELAARSFHVLAFPSSSANSARTSS